MNENDRTKVKPYISTEGRLKQEIITDPFGMYTGIPADPDERPIQDADDL